MANVILIVLWIIFMIWIGCWCFGVVECIIRPASIPYLLYTHGGCKGKNILWIILAIVPGYMIFGFVFWLWALPQFILNCLPYCEHKCHDLAKPFPANVKPLIITPTSKHPVYSKLLQIIGMACLKKPLNADAIFSNTA